MLCRLEKVKYTVVESSNLNRYTASGRAISLLFIMCTIFRSFFTSIKSQVMCFLVLSVFVIVEETAYLLSSFLEGVQVAASVRIFDFFSNPSITVTI